MNLRKLSDNIAVAKRTIKGTSIIALLLIAAVLFTVSVPTDAARLRNKFLQLESSQPGTVPQWLLGFNTMTSGTLGSVLIQMCEEYQHQLTDPCTAPPGLDMDSPTLSGQGGPGDFTVGSATANTIILTRTPSALVPTNLQFQLDGITNPSTTGTKYVRISTYASNDATGPEVDFGSLAIAIANALQISVEVPPYLDFCTGVTISAYNCAAASGNSVNLGELSTSATKSATSQFLTATNAANGYTVTLSGTTMTAGIRTIPTMTGNASQIGTSQFGINLRQNTVPAVGADPEGGGSAMPTANYNTSNVFRFFSGDIIASASGIEDHRKMTVSYIANISPAQEPGHYVSTATFIALANF